MYVLRNFPFKRIKLRYRVNINIIYFIEISYV